MGKSNKRSTNAPILLPNSKSSIKIENELPNLQRFNCVNSTQNKFDNCITLVFGQARQSSVITLLSKKSFKIKQFQLMMKQ